MTNWVDSFVALGATSAVLTAKHGCGFLAWETATTLPDGSAYRYHVSAEQSTAKKFVAATTAAGIGHGFYYSLTNNFYVRFHGLLHAARLRSPHLTSPLPPSPAVPQLNVFGHNAQPPSTLQPGQANVTQAQYEDLALAQVKELWTEFGSLSEIWLDGGCGAMCDRVGALVRATLAKDAVAFNGGGVSDSPVRWCGTEGGNPVRAGGAVWSTTACPDTWCGPGSGSGSPPNTTNAIWYPSGVDVTLQQGDHWL